jgi:hypothetical protein
MAKLFGRQSPHSFFFITPRPIIWLSIASIHIACSMFGPLTVLHRMFLARCLGYSLHIWWARKRLDLTYKANDATIPWSNGTCNQLLDFTLNAIILSGLILLLFAPHQEPRF